MKVRTSLSSLSFPAIATTCRGSGGSGLHQVADHRVHVLTEYAVGLHDLDVAEAHCQEQLHAASQYSVWEHKVVLAASICSSNWTGGTTNCRTAKHASFKQTDWQHTKEFSKCQRKKVAWLAADEDGSAPDVDDSLMLSFFSLAIYSEREASITIRSISLSVNSRSE